MNSSLKIGMAAVITILFLSFLTNNGCEKKDHDDCDGLPQDSCQVDTCMADSCLSDTNQAFCDGSIDTWQFLGLPNEEISSIAFHPSNSKILYIGTLYGTIYKSADCGQSWDTLLITNGSITDITIDPVNSLNIYAAPYDLQKSTDGGITWQSSSIGIQIDADTRVLTFAIEPWNTSVLYAGTGGFFGGRLYKSTDAGKSWFSIIPNPYGESLACLELDLNNPGTIYAGRNWSGTLLKSTNFGISWDTTGLSETFKLLRDIFIDEDGCIYVAMDGVRRSCDGGSSWSDFSQGIPSPVRFLKITKNTTTREFFAIYSQDDDGWIYRRGVTDSLWTQFGISEVRKSYYYLCVAVSLDRKFLYVGPNGLYRYRFP